MESLNIKAAIEAMLFAKGKPLSADEMAAALEISREDTIKYLTELTDDYMSEERGIHVVKINGRFELATKKEFYTVLASMVSKDNNYQFTEAMLETLSIIAYRQPVTRTQVEDIRGVGCSGQISRLVEYGLIYESDRLNAPGRPFLFSTTDEFLRLFNLSSLDDLPEISDDLMSQMKLEVEHENPGNADSENKDAGNDEDQNEEQTEEQGSELNDEQSDERNDEQSDERQEVTDDGDEERVDEI